MQVVLIFHSLSELGDFIDSVFSKLNLKFSGCMKNYYLNRVNHDELMEVFHQFFGGALYSNEYKICFKRKDNSSGKEISIDVLYSKKYNIKEIRDSGLPIQEKKELEEKIKKILIDTQKEKVARCVCFINQKLGGAIAHRDLFQVIPILTEPFTNGINSSSAIRLWPVILEVKYCGSDFSPVDSHRISEKRHSVLRILNAITRYQFTIDQQCKEATWGFSWEDEDFSKSKIFQPGYLYPDFELIADTFSDINKYGIVEYVSEADYFKWTFQDNEILKLPQNFDKQIDTILNLAEAERKKFDIATTYFEKGTKVWRESTSLAFISFVIALEAFVESKKELCQVCKQPKYRIKERFNKFLSDVMPDIDRFPEFKEIIYDTRSTLAHGSKAFQRDIRPWSYSKLKQSHESSLQMNTYFIMKTIFFNWLNNQRQGT
jgi:Apea-like HEPN